VMEFDVAATILSPAERDLPHGNGEQAGIRELPLLGCPSIFARRSIEVSRTKRDRGEKPLNRPRRCLAALPWCLRE
jgi:hypothetical protein